MTLQTGGTKGSQNRDQAGLGLPGHRVSPENNESVSGEGSFPLIHDAFIWTA